MTGKYHRVTVPPDAVERFSKQLDAARYPWTATAIYDDPVEGETIGRPRAFVFDVAVHDAFDIAAVDRKARRARQETT